MFNLTKKPLRIAIAGWLVYAAMLIAVGVLWYLGTDVDRAVKLTGVCLLDHSGAHWHSTHAQKRKQRPRQGCCTDWPCTYCIFGNLLSDDGRALKKPKPHLK